MKKAICVIMLLSVTTVSLFAHDYDEFLENGISFGSAFVLGNEKAGAYGELGFGIFKTPDFYMRNYIFFGGGGVGSEDGYAEIGDKLVLGLNMSVTEYFAIRWYSIAGLSFTMFGGEGKIDWTKGFMLTLQLGSGLEFMYGSDFNMFCFAFFLEALGGVEVIVGDGDVALLHQKYPAFENTYVSISLGGRIYF